MEKQAHSELMLRINSAVVLAAIGLASAYAGPATFAALIFFFSAAMAWEWGRVVRGKSADGIFFLQCAATAGAAALTLAKHPAFAVALILATTAGAFWLHRLGRLASDAWWSAAGVYYVGFPAIALIAIRQDPQYGFYAVLYLFVVVWSADTGAYFAGRLVGGPKLAPSISPNKTWTGLIGGALCASIAGAAFAAWLGGTEIGEVTLVSLALGLLSQGGDLGESFVKRCFGVKNSSSLIPGHGGVLDRMDGLVFAAIGAGLIAAAGDPSKLGRALLIW